MTERYVRQRGDSVSQIKKRILKDRGIGGFKKGSRKPVTIADTPANYKKTHAMKLVEVTWNRPLEELIFNGTIYEVGKRLDLDPTTISKWRTIVSESKEKAFWSQFPDEQKGLGLAEPDDIGAK